MPIYLKDFFNVQTLSGTYAIIWGLFLANPWIDSFGRAPGLYYWMYRYIPSSLIWGTIFVAVGLFAIYLTTLAHKPKPACVLLTFVFLVFASLFFMSDYTYPAWGFHLSMAIWNFARYKIIVYSEGKAPSPRYS